MIFSPVNDPLDIYAEEEAYNFQGRIHSIRGNSFSLQNEDQIVIEIWSYGIVTDENITFGVLVAYNGPVQITNETALSEGPASKVIPPMSLLDIPED